MKRNQFQIAILVAVVACGSKESPFVDGVPPVEIQEQFLAACQERKDERRPGANEHSMAGSEMPGPGQPRPASMCRVFLDWEGTKIISVSVEVYNDGPLLDHFVRTSVLPLLKPAAREVVAKEILDHIAVGPRDRKRTRVLGGVVRTGLEKNIVDQKSFAYGELYVGR